MSSAEAKSTEEREALGNEPEEVAQSLPSTLAAFCQSLAWRARKLDTASNGSW